MPLSSSTKVTNAVNDAKRAALIEHARQNPKLTLGDIVKLGDGLGALGKTITIAEILGRKSRARIPQKATAAKSNSKTSGPVLSLRSKEARTNYEAKVLSALKSASGPLSAVALREKVGGSPNQLRAALKTWGAAKKIKRQGETRATTYTAK